MVRSVLLAICGTCDGRQ